MASALLRSGIRSDCSAVHKFTAACEFVFCVYHTSRWAGHVARMGEDRGVHRVLVGKPEGKRPLGRPRRRWEDDIKMDLQEVGRGRGD